MWKLDKSKLLQGLASALEVCGAHRLALRYIQKALTNNPDNTDLHMHASRLYLKGGQVDKAALHCKKAAIGVGPGGFLYWINKASNGSYFYPQNKNENLDLQEETPSQRDTLEDKAVTFNNSGIYLLQQHRYQEAITCFEQAMKASGIDPVILTNIGLAYTKMKEYPRALEIFERAQALGYSNLELLIHKGYNLFYLNRYEEAVTCFELARQISPEDSAVLCNLGSCYQSMGMFNEAVDCFEIALGITPEDATMYNNLALCFEQLDQLDKAKDNYIKALELSPQDVIIMNNFAACLGRLGEYEKAVQLCDQALILQPNNYETWGVKGNLLIDMGKNSEAGKAFARALGLSA